MEYFINDLLSSTGKQVEIQRSTVTEGGYLGESVTWNKHITTLGAIQTLSGNEILSAEKRGIKATHRMFCNVVDLTEKDRVLFNGKYYQVKFVDNPMEQDAFYIVTLERNDNYGNQSN